MLQETISENHKVLVFSQFVRHLSIVREFLDREQIPYAYLDGATKNRQGQVEKFQTDDSCKVFLISLKAGGVGLNLTKAEYVFLLDPWWNPAVEAQAVDRVHRIGQKNPVLIYRMIAPGTVEERIEELKQEKRELFSTVVGDIPDMTDWTRHFTSLDALIRLSDSPAAAASAEAAPERDVEG